MTDPDTKGFFRKLMEACLAVGQSPAPRSAIDWVDDRMTFSENAPAGMKASMAHDLEAGNRVELDWLAGKVVDARQGAWRADAGQRRHRDRGTAPRG